MADSKVRNSTTQEKEIWRGVPGLYGLYEVSSYGRVRSVDRVIIKSDGVRQPLRGKMIKQITDKQGNPTVSLYKYGKRNFFFVCRLVSSVFLGPSNNQIIHKNGDITDNFVGNLIYKNDTDELKGEVWRDIEGFEGKYMVSNIGRIKSKSREVSRRGGTKRLVREKILKTNLSKHGYEGVFLCDNGKRTNAKVHRLVLSAFIENKENKRTVNHKNGIKDDNRLENLEWATHSENTVHSYKNGLQVVIPRRGENSPVAKLSKEDVRRIYYLASNKVCPQAVIAKEHGINQSTVSDIKRRKRWAHLDMEVQDEH